MAARRRHTITTRAQYAWVWVVVVLALGVVLLHTATALSLLLAGETVEAVTWLPIVYSAMPVVWGTAVLIRYHRSPTPPEPEETEPPAIWWPRER
ncbi:hypothetical protein GCM10023224_45450 [Streptomonospora halophila]|uniref:DUF2842 domain-containing protein n=1 Tax=Streptomonospora halophila TaxID=427369 RepID=A0ABP9GVV5_9ACTN